MSKNTPIPSDFHALLYDAKHLSDKIEIALLESDGEITKNLEELLAFKDYTEKALADSVDVVAMTNERIDMAIDYYQQQIHSIEALRDGLHSVKFKLMANLEQEMNRLGLNEINGLTKTIAFRNNPPKVDVFNESVIPDDYKKITMIEAIDKKLISEKLKNGVDVPGCRLIQGKTLSIKKARPQLKQKESESDSK